MIENALDALQVVLLALIWIQRSTSAQRALRQWQKRRAARGDE